MKIHIWAPAILLAVSWGVAAPASQSVVTYHNSLDRHGAYTVPGLTLAAAAGMHMDKSFQASLSGHVYAQPLFWKPAGAGNGVVIAATESNLVYALDAKSGAVVWQSKLAGSVPLSDLPCGDIDPEGITGTPVIDPAAGVLYLDALTKTAKGPRQKLYALSLADGSVVANWPLDVETGLAALGVKFSSSTQGERSALLFFRGALYVDYGGRYGDCGTYHGTVIQVNPSTPAIIASWATRANGGGIWAQGGGAGDGDDLYVTTGNTFNAAKWSDGEAIIRLRPGLARFTNKDTKNYFAPTNWMNLDNEDADLGGTEALPLNIAVPNSPPAKRVLALGKDGNAYLVDRGDLGGIGGALAVTTVSNQAIRTAPAVYSTSAGTMVAFTNSGSASCSSNNETMLNVAANGTSLITEVWCAAFSGGGAPIITTTDGTANPIVWVVGAEGDNLLHGFNAQNGKVVFSGGNAVMSGLRHFQTILATERRFYVAADNKVYAFTF